jgi:hypothetical protein
VISTLVFAGIIPSTLLAVDGSARTLTWVDVIPSTGTIVGCRGGVRGVSVGIWAGFAGNVEGTSSGVAEGTFTSRIWASQPAIKKTRIMEAAVENLSGTAGL